MIYIIIMIFASITLYPVKFKNRNNYNSKSKFIEKVLIVISFLITLLPMGLRYGIGTDYFYTYVPHFYGIAEGTMNFSEIGYNLINKIIYELTGDYRVLFFVTSFIFLYFIYKGIYENSDNIFISCLLIFLNQSYFYSMNMVRQAIAIAIIFYAYKYIKRKQRIKYVLFCLLASTIHISALLMVPLVLLTDIKLSNKKRVILIIFLMVLEPLIGEIIENIVMHTQYAWYYTSRFNTGASPIILIVLNILIFVLNIIYTNKEDDDYKILTNINFIGICIMIFSSSIPVVSRLVRYFTIFQILLLPKIFKQEKNPISRLLLEFIVLGILFLVMYYQIIILKGEQVFPYRSIFDV